MHIYDIYTENKNFFFIIGIIYLHNCTVQSKKPFFLIVVVGVELVIFLARLIFYQENDKCLDKTVTCILTSFPI